MSIKRPHRRVLKELHSFISPSLSPPTQKLRGSEKSMPDAYSFAEAIIEAVHEPVIILDKSLTILSANKALFKNFKFPKSKLLRTNLLDFADQSPEIKQLTERLRALSTHKISFDEFELTHTFPKIGERTLLINAKRIEFGDFATDFLLLGLQDITKRKIIEQQKDDFVGYVTHELKTPITTVVAFVQILQGYHEKTGDKRSQFLLAKINNQMKRLTGLLNSFTNVYKAQTSILEFNKQKFDLNTVVHDVVESFQYMSTTHNLIVQGTTTKPIRGDREKIYEVLVNLIMNAIKYSPNADKVKIKLEESPTHMTVSVKDYGVGIPREEQQKVFERFFRVKSKMKYKIEGLGLGLYLAASIIKGHKGKLWVESTEGKGSTFFFSLPIND